MKPVLFPMCDGACRGDLCMCAGWGVVFEDANGAPLLVAGEGPCAYIDEDPPSSKEDWQ